MTEIVPTPAPAAPIMSAYEKSRRIETKKRDKYRILFIGWNCAPNDEYVQRLRMAGHYVFWIGQGPNFIDQSNTGKQIVDTLEAALDKSDNELAHRAMASLKAWVVGLRCHPELDLINLMGQSKEFRGVLGEVPVQFLQRRFKDMLHIVGEDYDVMGEEFDVIVHTQNWIDWTDMDKSPIPYLFFASEPFYTPPPKCAWEIATPSLQYSEFMRDHYGGRYRKYRVLPWAMRDNMRGVVMDVLRQRGNDPQTKSAMLFSPNGRPVGCSWAGKIHGYKFYEFRREIVLKMKELLGEQFEGHWTSMTIEHDKMTDAKRFVPESGRGHLPPPEYAELLTRSKFGLNVNTAFGANFRDFEIPGCGANLLTMETPDMKALGFEDGKNCIFYKSAEEAVDIVKHGYDQEIGVAGWRLVNEQHTYINRTQHLLGMIEELVNQ